MGHNGEVGAVRFLPRRLLVISLTAISHKRDPVQDSKRSMSRKLQILIPVLLVIGALAVAAVLFKLRPQAPEGNAPEKTWPVLATTINAASRSPQLRLLGRVETPFQSTLTAAVTADVAALPALEGQHVSKGDVLVQLDDSEVRLLMNQREADVAELESQLAQEKNQFAADRNLLKREQNLVAIASRGLDRAQKLAQSNLTSKSQTDQSRQALEAAEISRMNRQLAVDNHASRLKSLHAKLDRANALLEQAKLDLGRATVKAPFDGIITDIAVSPGERVRPGETLASLYAAKKLEVRAQVPMKRIASIEQALAGDKAISAYTGSDDHRRQLELDRLSGQVNAGGGGIDGLFRFTGEAPAGALNRTVNITLELPARERLFAVPVSALYDENTLYRISEGHLAPVQVEVVGDRFEKDQQQLLIRSRQLSDGDQILKTQLPNAISGLPVKIQTDTDKTAPREETDGPPALSATTKPVSKSADPEEASDDQSGNNKAAAKKPRPDSDSATEPDA